MTIDFAIDEFGSEGQTGPSLSGAVPVGDVLARSVPIHWDEAVALLQEVIDTMTSAHRDDIPSFDDVLIDATGVVSVSSTRRGERGPVAAGRALHALLSTADVPVALRLFVTQATAPDTHESLQAFANGLAYFGKSGRTELIRSVHARYQSTVGTAGTAVPPPAATLQRTPALTPVPAAPKAAFVEPVRPSKRTMPRLAVAAMVALVVVSGSAVVWLTMVNGTGQSSDAAAQSAATAPGDGKLPASTSTQAGSKTKAPTPTTPPTGSDSGKSQAAALPTPRFPALSPRDRIDPNAGLVPTIVAYETLRAPSAVESSEPSEDVDRTDPAKAIYSREDTDVQPPVMLYPQMPPPLIVGASSQAIVNQMELVIATDGSVERVRLVSVPRRMADMMLLSGAKLWKFAPAVKDGAPVRYRTTLSWTVFP